MTGPPMPADDHDSRVAALGLTDPADRVRARNPTTLARLEAAQRLRAVAALADAGQLDCPPRLRAFLDGAAAALDAG